MVKGNSNQGSGLEDGGVTRNDRVQDPAVANYKNIKSEDSTKEPRKKITSRVRIRGRNFVDRDSDEVIQLRGFSISSRSKIPSSPFRGYEDDEKDRFFDSKSVSFIDHPLKLNEAKHYLQQIKDWGYNLIRLVVCWESLEHNGPGDHDHDYINYLVRLVRIAQGLDLKVLIDCHQDVWSRFSGGSGAPGWTLELAGFQLQNLVETRSVALHHKRCADTPTGVWPSGYQKLAAATMFTLFFGGNCFAPELKISKDLHKVWSQRELLEGEESTMNVQDFLQNCMVEAFGVLADALEGFECVIGFEPMNEPHRGFIDLYSPYKWNPTTDLLLHDCPSFLESVALGEGHPQKVQVHLPTWPIPSMRSYKRLFKPKSRAWKESYECIWKNHGVWKFDDDLQKPIILKKDYFKIDHRTGKRFEFYRDGFFPFIKKFSERAQKSRDDWLISVGPIPNELYPRWELEDRPKNLVAGPHFYDLYSLHYKSHGSITLDVQAICKRSAIWKWFYFGHSGAKKNYEGQIKNIIESAYKNLGDLPVLVGETGVCMDLNGSQSFRDGNFYWQEVQMDSILSAIESLGVSFVVWNFDPYNTNEFGDYWNGENFSVMTKSKPFTKDQDEKSKAGGAEDGNGFGKPRLLDSIRRPYVKKLRGFPVKSLYDFKSFNFEFEFKEFDRAYYKSNSQSHKDDDRSVLESRDQNVEEDEERGFSCEIYWPFAFNDKSDGKSLLDIETSDGIHSFDNQTKSIIWRSRKNDSKILQSTRKTRANHWIKIADRSRLKGELKEVPIKGLEKKLQNNNQKSTKIRQHGLNEDNDLDLNFFKSLNRFKRSVEESFKHKMKIENKRLIQHFEYFKLSSSLITLSIFCSIILMFLFFKPFDLDFTIF